MASQTALQSETATGIEKVENQNEFIIHAEKIFDRINELYQSIEKRAYELFEERGYEEGHDAEDWFRAESEYLMKVPVEINEYDTSIVVRAEMPGFDAKEINVSIEPHHLIIAASTARSVEEKKEEGSSIEQNLKEVFCSLALPCEVEADQAKASFKDGLLEISMPRLGASQAQAVEAKME